MIFCDVHQRSYGHLMVFTILGGAGDLNLGDGETLLIYIVGVGGSQLPWKGSSNVKLAIRLPTRPAVP